MTTATATAEKTVFKRETLELKNIHVYTQNDRINQKSRVGDRAYDNGLVKDILFSPMLWATLNFHLAMLLRFKLKAHAFMIHFAVILAFAPIFISCQTVSLGACIKNVRTHKTTFS
ncbi:hypothetical protein [Acinetobacter haemolyticus]|uniref:hypothetical protein n=1 Tax=Acinetobacter haemolyticus TaxID=29430 RepID=UPI001D196BE2|nr:hypothetical protein [Acinetobacter haemolyticus]